jgi:DNA polymerase I
MSVDKLLLIDGNNLVHRAYHALPPLTVRRTGEVVNAVYGFTSMLLKVLSEQKPEYYAIAFDKKGPTFRHELFEGYKADRPKMTEDLSAQLEKVREVVREFNIPIFEITGYEADDVLGTLSRQAAEQGIETLVLTGDADAMQLVGPCVSVLYPKARQGFSETALFDAQAVQEKYGVGPERIADYKALMGDPSDSIPGVHGVGEKTAVKLIQQYGSVEDIYAHLAEITPARLQGLLREGEAMAAQSKELATIDRHVPVELSLQAARATGYNRDRAVALLRDLEFFTLLNRLPAETDSKTEAVPVTSHVLTQSDYHAVTNPLELQRLASGLSGSVAFDLISEGTSPMTACLVGLSLSPAPGQAYYIPSGHAGLEASIQPDIDLVRKSLSPVLAAAGITKSTHNAGFALTTLGEYNFSIGGLAFDTALAAHLLGEASLELKSLVLSKLGLELPSLPTGSGTRKIPVSQLDIQAAADCACASADMIGRLAQILEKELRDKGLWQLFSEVEMPLVAVLVKMQRHGVLLDTGLLAQMSVRLGDRLKAIEGEIYMHAKHEFNLNSPKQLGVVLFEELQLPTDKKKGNWSTEAAVLEGLLNAHPVISYIIEYRQLTKLKSTYIDALPGLINPRTGRLHTNFNQTRTSTGRLSSSDPNLQNIPVRGELGREIRRAFIAPPGSVLLSCDYSQIDLRALAHLSQDPLLLSTFARGEDVHTATAVQLFEVAPDKVTADMRRLAKTVNFGVIYGMSGYGLEQATEFSRQEAERFIAAYFERYAGVRSYLEGTKKEARDKGYVQTILGRRRYILEITSANRLVREAGERMAINMPVQGTSADIIKLAMLHLEQEMCRRCLKSKLILQVHDELIFEVPEVELPVMQEIVPDLMVNALKLSVPVKVDIKTGKSWGEME